MAMTTARFYRSIRSFLPSAKAVLSSIRYTFRRHLFQRQRPLPTAVSIRFGHATLDFQSVPRAKANGLPRPPAASTRLQIAEIDRAYEDNARQLSAA